MSKQGDRPFRAVVDYLTAQIANGQLCEGERLPSVAKLAEQFRASRGTIDRAMLILEDRELIRGEPGLARWVADGARQRAAARQARGGDRP